MTKSKTSSPMRPNSTRVIGIDPGFDRVGIAILDKSNGKEKLLFSTCLVTDNKSKREERLLSIGTAIERLIRKWEPESMAIETLFFNQNISSALGVSEARGIIIYEAMKRGLKVCEYSPQAIKIAVTGYGKATKPQVEAMVMKLVSIEQKEKARLDDEVDAVAVGITHLASSKSLGYPHK